MIPNDIWRYIAHIGGPIVRYKLSCCNRYLYSILPSFQRKPLTAHLSPRISLTSRPLFSPRDMELFWRMWNYHHPMSLIGYYPPPSHVTLSNQQYPEKHIYSVRTMKEESIILQREYFERYITVISSKHGIRLPIRMFNILPFAVYEYLDVCQKITLAEQRMSDDTLVEAWRYNLIILIDQGNDTYLNSRLDGLFEDEVKEFILQNRDETRVAFVIERISAFIRIMSGRRDYDFSYRCYPEINRIHCLFWIAC